ncbi:hypothetical protein VF14_36705 [Nostoc linckia z18]|uniref:Uncharacterized protein n=2 Tax=Nostoc linckia TaxID=92942 RepID=A0A9Q5Z473_NOSLI|nr:hypothetical protein [Nostoc linckia]PHJ56166.1 hypothetical protein VF03_37840 [Nostoc linckia z2]PHJ70631.1 hypothetical protein VF06_37565 [Nostoc linckia z4]PHJ79770.1 hypothetical protein VF07_33205 [Nostoc linckia z6]PHJ81082.1 hypothetical protein VF04_37740 [Nostoc linckia z7]PHJ90096.1 hypothetical protein VF08_37470 [Nostoc linckia z8]PHJ95581.1 hypothetical protein VF09_36615 [Nostoc linckia z9]PHK08468.1 hypothetical protein VF10_36920 [Nostoc linckia z13]PHK09241.1 hypotheti
MFGFDGEAKGFQSVIERISANYSNVKLDHKEVRAYARCMLKILPELDINSRFKPEIQTLLAAISASGLPHYDRSFLASKILELLKDDVFLKSSNDESNIFSADNF